MTPTVGRIILCVCAALSGERPAIITGVNGPDPDATIDIAPQLRPQDARQPGDHAVGSVSIYESAEAAKAAIDSAGGPLWAAYWMPYQTGQAAKTEAAEGELKARIDQMQAVLDQHLETLEKLGKITSGLADRQEAGADAQRDVNARLQKAIENLSNNKEAGPMGGRLTQAVRALASACSGEQQQLIKNILDGVEATPAE